MNVVLEQKKKDRFRFLKNLYDKSGGHPHAIEMQSEIAASLAISDTDADLITRYLEGEGLIQYRTMGGGLSITHEGVKQIEAAFSEPSHPTKYFPPINIINVGTMTHSQIQQGTVGSQQSQNISNTQLEKALEAITEAIRESKATEDQKEIAETCVDLILNQSKLPQEHRDQSLIKKTWEKLTKLNTVISLSKAGYAAYSAAEPIIRMYFSL